MNGISLAAVVFRNWKNGRGDDDGEGGGDLMEATSAKVKKQGDKENRP